MRTVGTRLLRAHKESRGFAAHRLQTEGRGLLPHKRDVPGGSPADGRKTDRHLQSICIDNLPCPSIFEGNDHFLIYYPHAVLDVLCVDGTTQVNNCKSYNREGSEYYEAAVSLEAYIQHLLAQQGDTGSMVGSVVTGVVGAVALDPLGGG